jgi:hypothetical protein
MAVGSEVTAEAGCRGKNGVDRLAKTFLWNATEKNAQYERVLQETTKAYPKLSLQ